MLILNTLKTKLTAHQKLQDTTEELIMHQMKSVKPHKKSHHFQDKFKHLNQKLKTLMSNFKF